MKTSWSPPRRGFCWISLEEPDSLSLPACSSTRLQPRCLSDLAGYVLPTFPGMTLSSLGLPTALFGWKNDLPPLETMLPGLLLPLGGLPSPRHLRLLSILLLPGGTSLDPCSGCDVFATTTTSFLLWLRLESAILNLDFGRSRDGA